MKKWVSFFLVLVLLTASMPAGATVVTPMQARDTYIMPERELKTLLSDVGLEDEYYEGMSYSRAMSAYQKYCCFTDFRENELAEVKTRCAALMVQLEEAGDRKNLERAKELNNALQKQDAFIQYMIFGLDDIIRVTADAYRLTQKGDSQADDIPAAWRDLQEVRKRLDSLNDEIDSKNPFFYQISADELKSSLDELSKKASGERTGEIWDASAGMPTISSGENDDGKSDFTIVILRADQIGFQVNDQKNRPVSGADVTLKAGGKTLTAKTSAEGVVYFSITDMNPDDHNRVWAEVKIEKKGMRIYESHGLRCRGGESTRVVLAPDDGEPYIQFMTFRGMDILYGKEKVWYSPANDAAQPFEVGIHTKPGKTGTFAMEYVDASTNEEARISQEVKGVKDEVVTLNFQKKWCQILAPKQPVTISYTDSESNAAVFECADPITTEQSAVSTPLAGLPNSKGGLSGTSFSFTIPTGMKKPRDKITASLSVPAQLFVYLGCNFNLFPDGDFMFSVAVTRARDYADKKDKSWKLDNNLKALERFEDYTAGVVTMQEIAQAGIDKRGARTSWLDLLGSKGTFTISAVLNGSVEKDTERAEKKKPEDAPYAGKLNLFLSAAYTHSISLNQYSLIGPVPFTWGFDFSFGGTVGLNFPFTFEIPSGKPHDALNLKAWKNFKPVKEGTAEFIFAPKISFSLFGCAGIKGLLAFGIQGYAGASAGLHIRPLGDQVVYGSWHVTAGVKAFVDYLLGSAQMKIFEVDKKGPIGPKQKGGQESEENVSGDETGAVTYVTPMVSDVTALTGENGVKTVRMGSDLYCFSLEKVNRGGEMRTWLKCRRIHMNAFGMMVTTEIPLTDLGSAAYGTVSRTGGIVPDDARVVTYDVTSSYDLCQDGQGPEMIAIHVFLTDPNSAIIKNKTVIASCQFYEEVYYLMPDGTSAVKLTHQSVRINTAVFSKKSAEEANIECAAVTIARDMNDKQRYYVTTVRTTNDADPFSLTHRTQRFTYDKGKVDFDMHLSPVSSVSLQRRDKQKGKLYDRIMQVSAVRTNPYSTDIYSLCTTVPTEDGKQETVFEVRSSYEGYKGTNIILNDDIASFRVFPAFGKTNAMIALVSQRNENGLDARSRLMVTEYTTTNDGKPALSEPRELVSGISPAGYQIVDLGPLYALYYLQTMPVETGSTTSGRYTIRAIYMGESSDGRMFATKPFNIAAFAPTDLDVDKGVTEFRMFGDRNGFLQGLLTERGTVSAGTGKDKLKYFNFRQTLQVDIREILVEDALTKPGETVNLLFSLMNTGNMPASKVLLNAYALNRSTGKRIPLEQILINCADPESSRVTVYDADKDGAEVCFTLSGTAAVSLYEGALPDEMNQFIVNNLDGSTEVYTTKVLMPEETHLYRSAFVVPRNFEPAKYGIYVSVAEISTLVSVTDEGRLDGSGAWLKTLYNLDAADSGNLPKAASDGGLMTLTAKLQDPWGGAGAAEGEAVPVTLTVEGMGSAGTVTAADDPELFSAFSATTVSDLNEVLLDAADLSIAAQLTRHDGTDYAHIVIRNETASPESNIVLTADLGGGKTYTLSLGNVTLQYMQTISMDIPISTLTGGKTDGILSLHVDGNGNDVNDNNNTAEIPLTSTLMIVQDPVNQSVLEGSDATFSVTAGGGKKPYAWQWQVSIGGKNGPWIDIKDATDRILTLKGVKLSDNGNWYRCVVTDAAGRIVTSDAALLLVRKMPPPTGDTVHPALLAGLLLACLSAAWLLLKRKRGSIR